MMLMCSPVDCCEAQRPTTDKLQRLSQVNNGIITQCKHYIMFEYLRQVGWRHRYWVGRSRLRTWLGPAAQTCRPGTALAGRL